jgi:hypothetical protein
MNTTRPMTKSPLAVARAAIDAAADALPLYSCPKSRHDYTQPQLFAILALKQFFRTDYRGVAAILADSSDLRRELGLAKVPHYSTLAYAAARLLKKGGTAPSSGPCSPAPAAAA